MTRVSFKVTGAQGQGINSVGELCAKGLKRTGFAVFGYKEYMSLIKGGHSSYQLDVSDEAINSSLTTVDILVCFNHHGLENNVRDVNPGGVIIHQTSDWEWSAKDLEFLSKNNISVFELPVVEILRSLGAKPIFGNMIITSVVWKLLDQDASVLHDMVKEMFSRKGEEVVAMNDRCIEEGVKFVTSSVLRVPCSQANESHSDQGNPQLATRNPQPIQMPTPNSKWVDHMVLTGGEAMGLGIIRAGCRGYFAYPMTPASPILSYIAAKQNHTGMVVKQAEDEITAAQMMSGAMHMGTRAATGTSGGGFDLMTETMSLNGIIENPSLFIVAQRPGPATGLPTWSAQGDLLLSAFSAHGEFPRLVMSVSDADDGYELFEDAFNYAEEFQIPVIVLTDKHITEGIFTQKKYDSVPEIKRGLVTDPEELSALTPQSRYNPDVPNGISPRWLPGVEAATYCAQGDEHDSEGNVDESKENAIAQMEKRMEKMKYLKDVLPDPCLGMGDRELGIGEVDQMDLLIVSWGSNKGVIEDVLRAPEFQGKKIGYLHYTYLWPLRTQKLLELSEKASKTVLLECNHEGQLGKLIKMESGFDFDNRVLKYDGRPFFYDELLTKLSDLCEVGSSVPVSSL